MNQPRSANSLGKDFPYTSPTVCYVEVAEDGSVTWGREDARCQRAVAGKSRLYAVWPGKWSSHLFEIDDLDECARAFGVMQDAERTGLAKNEHDVRWSVSPYEKKPTGG